MQNRALEWGRSELDVTHGQADSTWFCLAAKTPLQIHRAYQHGAAWVEGQVLKPPARVEAAHTVIERMRDDAHMFSPFALCSGSVSRHEFRT